MAKQPSTKQQKSATKKATMKKAVTKKKTVTKKTTTKKTPQMKAASVLAALNWWVHKFVNSGVTAFRIDHTSSQPGEVQKLPNDLMGVTTIEAVEILWGTMTAVDDSNWYVHRKNGTTAWRTFQIDHVSTGVDTCGPYPSIAYMVSHHVVSTIFRTNTNPIQCPS